MMFLRCYNFSAVSAQEHYNSIGMITNSSVMLYTTEMWSKFSYFFSGYLQCTGPRSSLTADPGVRSLIPPRFHTLGDMDREVISTAILLPSADSRTGLAQALKVLEFRGLS